MDKGEEGANFLLIDAKVGLLLHMPGQEVGEQRHMKAYARAQTLEAETRDNRGRALLPAGC